MAKYFYDTGNFVLLQNAHGATAGFCWLINPVSSGARVLVHQIGFASQHGSALVTAVPTSVSVERMTFTGTASGATKAACARSSGDPGSPIGSLRTAVTGMTPTAGNVLVSFLASVALTAVAAGAVSVDEWIARSSPLELEAGQGLVVRQSTAGVASDTRVISLEFHVEEVT